MLDGDEIRTDQWDVVDLPEHADNTAVVDTGNENGQKISQEGGLFLEVECQGFVVARAEMSERIKCYCGYSHFNICSAYNDVLELVVLPGVRGTFNHGQRSIVLLNMR